MYSDLIHVGRFFSPRRKMLQGIKKLMITSIALSQLTLPGFSYAASRVFFDNFENGKKSSAWDYTECPVVTRAQDGGAPHGGSAYMLQCNWNGAVAWNDEASMQDNYINYFAYNNEFLVRFWVRYDQDVDHKVGSKLFRLGFGGLEEIIAACQMEQGDNATLWIGLNGLPTFWGSPQGICGDHRWHKIALYNKYDTNGSNGLIRVWVDDIMVKEWANTKTHTPGAHRYPFHLISNWSSNPGWEHDANNHVYFNDVEIFSDVGTGASGSMADGTISASGTGGNTSSLELPKNLRVVQ